MKSFGFVFPGQGSQSLGMLADIANVFPEVTATFQEASDVLGYDLWELTQKGPLETINQTIHTQPIMLVSSYAIWRILEPNMKGFPAVLAGHSLGEYTALVAAKAISFRDAVNMVASRGRYMQQAVSIGEGALAAIVGLDETVIIELCHEATVSDEIVAPANFNSPQQIVIAGHVAPVMRVMEAALKKGARLAKLLPVSVPSHCLLMKPAAQELEQLLQTFVIQMTQCPVINNVNVGVYQSVDAIRQGLIQQLYTPVQWVKTIHAFAERGVTQIVECGPGKVLTGLNKRIEPAIQLTHTTDLGSLRAFIDVLLRAEKE